jgi:hypothetical protein
VQQLAEEFINPYDMSRLSIAEMNLLEKMKSDSKILADEILELKTMFQEILGKNMQAARNRMEKIRKHKEDLQAEGFKTLEYLVRTGLGLQFKDIYAEVITGMIAVGESAADVSLYLDILNSGSSIPGDVAKPIEELILVVEGQAKKLEDLLASLNVNPKTAPKDSAEIEALEEQADEVYRNTIPYIIKNMSKSPEALVPVMEIIERLEGISDTLWRLSIYLKYVAMHRT